MGILEEKIKEFLKVDSFSGFGYGDGYGSGFGSGSGCSDGCGFGSGSSSGDGYGFGYGDGFGFGSGSGCSDGCGFGSGSGFGYGDGLKSINSQKIYKIDNINTIITSIHNNIAKGFILSRDLTLEKCYIAKGQNKFAHGETIKKAVQSLSDKIYEDLDVDEAIEEFRKKFNKIWEKEKKDQNEEFERGRI